MDDLLQQFVIEAIELTQQAADDLLALERDTGSRPHLESAFRAIHTLKGSVGLFDLAPMHDALHVAEDVLSLANREGGELRGDRVDPLIAIVEWIDRCVRQLAAGGSLAPAAPEQSRALIAALGQPRGGEDVAMALPTGVPAWAESLFVLDASADSVAIRYTPSADCFFSGDDPVALMSSLPGLVACRVATQQAWEPLARFDPFRSNLVFEALSTAPRREIETIFRLLPDQVVLVPRPHIQAPTRSALAAGPETSRMIRVEVDRVDALVDAIGELFTAKNAISELVAEARALEGGAPLARNIAAVQQELDRLAGRIQRAATGVRMIPLNDMFRRLPRLVREVSALSGKAVDLVVEGGEVEADKLIVDGIFEAALHVLRNAVDHGIEAPERRLERGKPPRGKIAVRARQAGHRIEIEVSDDGRGIDAAEIRKVAVDRGLVTPADADRLGDAESLELLFRSGFSTSQEVTGLSGRGVGMDAVRAAVQRLGGEVHLATDPGAGTRVILTLPSRLAAARLLILQVAGERYGVAVDAIVEITRIASSAIVAIRSGEAFVHRDWTIPLVRLADALGSRSTPRAEELVVIVEVAGMKVGLGIDAIGESFDTVLSAPAGLLKAVPALSGTTVLGDGQVVMVLDLEALVR